MNADRFLKKTALFSLLTLLTATVVLTAQSPLEPVDTTSPRATYTSFIVNMESIRDSLEKNAPRSTYEDSVSRAVLCFDLSQIAPAELEERGKASALMLIEILGRIEEPDPESFPEDSTSWSIPGTDIKIVLISEGDRAGEYLFSARTVARLDDFYAKAQRLPYREGAWEGAFITYLNVPGALMPTRWADEIPSWLVHRIFRIPLWKFISLILAVSILTAGAYLALIITRKIEGPPGKSTFRRQLGNVVIAGLVIIMLKLFSIVIRDVIGIRGRMQEFLLVIGFLFADLFLIFGTVAFFNLLFSILTSSKYFEKRKLNEHLIKVMVQLTAVAASTYIAIRSAEFLGLEIGPIIAGLGIGGIAIALAARQTVENVIGGLTLFADKPVKVGDLCKFGPELGFVEEIGLRSTRLRKLDDTLVSVPNAQFSQLELENRSLRRKFLYHTELQFRYETKADQLRYLLVTLREMLLAHPKTIQDKMRVRFLGFGSHSLDVEIFVYIRAADWPDSLSVREDMNFRIMDVVRASGAEFAFPSTTAYIAQDGERDEESIKKAEESVAIWKSEGRLPFPNHTRDDIRTLKGTLDYPPEGSVEAKPKTPEKLEKKAEEKS